MPYPYARIFYIYLKNKNKSLNSHGRRRKKTTTSFSFIYAVLKSAIGCPWMIRFVLKMKEEMNDIRKIFKHTFIRGS
jgi:hypothetical protein